MTSQLYEASNLSIKARLAVKKYCEETPASKRSWNDFNKNHNPNNITEDEYKEGIGLFGKAPGTAKPSEKPADNKSTKPIEKPVEKPVEKPTEKPIKQEPPKKDPVKDEKPTVRVVDGFNLSTEAIFNPTIKYLYGRYNEFNKKYFSNALPTIPIVFSNGKRVHGCYSYQSSRRMDELVPGTEKLSISKFFYKNEYDICNVLLHEMIHVYQLRVLKIKPSRMKSWRDAHNYTFRDKMGEINKFGWTIDVHVTEEEAQRCIVTPTQIAKMKKRGIVAMTYDTELLACTTRDRISYFKLCFRGAHLKFYTILDYAYFVRFTVCSKQLSGKGTTAAKIQNLVDTKKMIPMTSINESRSFEDDMCNISDVGMILLNKDGDIEEWAIA